MTNYLLVFWAKLLQKINIASIRKSSIHKTSKIGSYSNCINIKMGRYSYAGKNNTITNTEIGSFCSIANNCYIGGGEHPINYISTSPLFYTNKSALRKRIGTLKYDESAKTIIKNDVWIGENVFIKAGIVIGNGAIIGAHAVVTHDVPDYAIVAGVPAEIIKMRFTDQQIKKLNAIKWWNFDIDKIKKQSNNFSDIDKFIKENTK